MSEGGELLMDQLMLGEMGAWSCCYGDGRFGGDGGGILPSWCPVCDS